MKPCRTVKTDRAFDITELIQTVEFYLEYYWVKQKSIIAC